MWNNISDKGTRDLSENLRFENLIGELSSELINIPLESIDATIESSLKWK